MKAVKNNNAQVTSKMASIQAEESDLKAKLSAVKAKTRKAYAATYTADNTAKSRKHPTDLTNLFDIMRKQIYASEPQRFNFRVTGKVDSRIMDRLKVVINTISSALVRHIVKDCVITGQTLSFGLLRLPAVYIMILSSLCKPKNSTLGSLYDLLSPNPKDLADDKLSVVCEVYNMCVKLDCETYDQIEKYVANDESMHTILKNKESMLDYIKVKEAMYFGNKTNKGLVLHLLTSVYDKLSMYISKDSQVWKTNLNGMTLLRVFMPCFVILPSDLLPILNVNNMAIEQYKTPNTKLTKLCKLIVQLINDQDTDAKSVNLLNFVRNVTGSLSPPSKINISIDTNNYESWKPLLIYHTCFNSLDLRVNLLYPLMPDTADAVLPAELITTLSNYLFGDFSGNMSLA
jgi:hypothetical protein